MYFRCLSLLLLAALANEARTLRVCADPNNLPFSNRAQQGFENKIGEMIGRDMGARVEYVWFSQWKGFVDKSLNAGECDLLLGVPAAMDDVLVTRPYYSSSYVFVSRQDRHLNIASLTDARLAQYHIGVQVVGDDYAPPAVVLARRGLSANIASFSLFGTAGESNPAARIIEAVRRGDVDIAIVWGPLAGYFATSQGAALDIAPVTPAMFLGIPFRYELAAAVRKSDVALRNEVDEALARECPAIQKILADYGIPQASQENSRCESSPSSPLASR